MRPRVFALLACGLFPAVASAQVSVGVGVGTAPGWSYPGLSGGPYVTYPYPYAGWPGFRGARGSYWTNGLSLYGPPVPVYGPVPGVFGANDLNQQWRDRPTLGWGVGWVGIHGARVNTHRPSNVSVQPRVEVVSPLPASGVQPGASMILSVKVPQHAAEVFVDGQKTQLTGTDRTFESPTAEVGKEMRYELTARWIERGAMVERKKTVTGKPGEVVRVDFNLPDVVVGK